MTPDEDETPAGTSYWLSGAAWTIRDGGGQAWALAAPDEDETRAGAVLRYDTTARDDRTWRLVAWYDQPPKSSSDGAAETVDRRARIVSGEPGINVRPMRWTLSRHGLDGPQHALRGLMTVNTAIQQADQLLEEATWPVTAAANAAGEYCTMTGDPRHNVSRCPGFHT